MKIGQLCGRVALLLGSLVLAVVIAEVFLRLSDIWICRHSDHMFLLVDHDINLGWKMKPGVEATIDMFDVENIPVSANSDGFWDKPFARVPSQGRARVAFLGDSYTWGYGVHDEDRFTSLIGMSKETPGIEAMNFGIPAYGTDQALLVWRNVVSRYDPDVVVLTVVPNDYIDNVSDVRWGRAKPYFTLGHGRELELANSPVPATTFWDNGVLHRIASPYADLFPRAIHKRSRAADWLAKRSDVARLLHTALVGLSQKRTPHRGSHGKQSQKATLSQSKSLQLELLTALVLQLDREVRDGGGRMLVALASDSPLYRRQMSIFQEGGIRTIDLTGKKLAATMGVAPTEVYFRHNPHWRPDTHAVVASLLEAEIRTMIAEQEAGGYRR